jgi:hypothetical protein
MRTPGPPTPSRRRFVAAAAAAVAARLLLPARAWARAAAPRPRVAPPHPTPRPGITGARVLAREQLADAPELAPLFDAVRAIPGVVDGVRCHCGCAALSGNYSLLSCYEAPGMAIACPICQGQGRVVTRLHRAGKSLDEIRVAIDAQFA